MFSGRGLRHQWTQPPGGRSATEESLFQNTGLFFFHWVLVLVQQWTVTYKTSHLFLQGTA